MRFLSSMNDDVWWLYIIRELSSRVLLVSGKNTVLMAVDGKMMDRPQGR